MRCQGDGHLLFLGPTISVEDKDRGQCHPPCSKGNWAKTSVRPGQPSSWGSQPSSWGSQSSLQMDAHTKGPKEGLGVEGFRLCEGSPNTQVATVWLQQSGEGHLREGRDQERLESGRCGVGNCVPGGQNCATCPATQSLLQKST